MRVAQLCLPKLQRSNGDDHDTTITLHDESDLQVSTICSLWSGMGHIYKVAIPLRSAGGASIEFLVKHVAAPRKQQQRQSLGDCRKAASYQVEANFYDKLAKILIQRHGLRLPQPLLVERHSGKSKNEIVIGMSFVKSSSTTLDDDVSAIKAVLTWLATLHAAYWGEEQVNAIVEEVGLQPTGSYWHLDTRPDEHESMPNTGWEGRLKRAARAIDNRLKRDPLQCIIHGDAKDANVLFSDQTTMSSGPNDDDDGVPVVTLCDFQYCGKGPPSKDLAYFFCSSVNPEDEQSALDFYLHQLSERLVTKNVTPPSMNELQDSMDLAYCDFYRFSKCSLVSL